MPWDEWIKLALGKMQMQPRDFWEMSLQEFLLSVDGFIEFNSSGEPSTMKRDELEDLMERFPD
ncbi:MAG: phage tail assembly chaperone [Paracoccaceae bacterium]